MTAPETKAERRWDAANRAVRADFAEEAHGAKTGGELRVENLECHRPVVLEILGEIARGLQPDVNVRQQKARNEL